MFTVNSPKGLPNSLDCVMPQNKQTPSRPHLIVEFHPAPTISHFSMCDYLNPAHQICMRSYSHTASNAEGGNR